MSGRHSAGIASRDRHSHHPGHRALTRAWPSGPSTAQGLQHCRPVATIDTCSKEPMRRKTAMPMSRQRDVELTFWHVAALGTFVAIGTLAVANRLSNFGIGEPPAVLDG